MRRISLALALISAAAGCSMGSKPTAATAGRGTAKGEQGVYYYVNLFSPPMGGTITSDIAGTPAAINCGASGVKVVNAGLASAYEYTYIPGSTACGTNGQTRFAWADTVVLTAHNGAGTFIGWAGDCTKDNTAGNTCTLTNGADKTVVAIFGPAGGAHGNFLDPDLHGPAYLAFIANPTSPAVLQCTKCHGDALQGQGIAPKCASCHEVDHGTPLGTAGLKIVNPVISGLSATFSLQATDGSPVDLAAGSATNLPLGKGCIAAGGYGGPLLPPACTNTTISFGLGYFTVDGYGIVSPYTIYTQSRGAPTMFTPTALGNQTSGTATSGSQGAVACTTAAPCTCTVASPCMSANGSLVANATPGSYTYTFPSPTAYDAVQVAAATPHALFIKATRQATSTALGADSPRDFYTASLIFNFNPQTGAAIATKRELVTNHGCNACHDGFKPPEETVSGQFHSGAMADANMCSVCHNPGRTTSPDANSKVFVHRIHFSEELVRFTSGTQIVGFQGATTCGDGLPVVPATTPPTTHPAPCVCTVANPCTPTVFHGIADVTYPQDIRNCDQCHEATAAQGGQYLNAATRQACGSCHDTINFATGVGHELAGPTNAVQLNDSACAGCHGPGMAADIATHMVAVKVPDPIATYFWPNLVAGNAGTGYTQTQADKSVKVCTDGAVCACTATLPCAKAGTSANTNAAYIAAAAFAPPGAAQISYQIGSVSLNASRNPVMVFKMKNNGADVAFQDPATNREIMPNFVGAPSVYFVYATAQDGIAAPADFNGSASIYLKDLWAGSKTVTPAQTSGIINPVLPAGVTTQWVQTKLDGTKLSCSSLTPCTCSVREACTLADITTAGAKAIEPFFQWTSPITVCTTAAPCTCGKEAATKCTAKVVPGTLTGPDGSGFYTATLTGSKVPAGSVMLTGGLGYSYSLSSTQPLTQVNLAVFPYQVPARQDQIIGTTTDPLYSQGGVACGAAAKTCYCSTDSRCVNTLAVAGDRTGGIVFPTQNLWVPASASDVRRPIVDNAKCNGCHSQLGVGPTFHAGQRNDAPSCSWCHNPNRASNGWSANASTFIHGIHGAAARSTDFLWHATCSYTDPASYLAPSGTRCTVDGTETGTVVAPKTYGPNVTYPAPIRDCSMCHVADAFNFATAAAQAELPNLLWTSVASGKYSPNIANSSVVVADGSTDYGLLLSVNGFTGDVAQATGPSLVSSPIAAVCYSCHDTTGAKAHFASAGGVINTARSVAMPGGVAPASELCLNCHGKGAAFAIEAVHQ